MRGDVPNDVSEYVRVLFEYLNGNASLDAALTAWRAMPIEDLDADEDELEEDVLRGIDRDALHPEQQSRLTVFLEALEAPPPGH